MKKPNKSLKQIESDNFSFLERDKFMDDLNQDRTKPDSVAMSQAEFEKSAGTKAELIEFLEIVIYKRLTIAAKYLPSSKMGYEHGICLGNNGR